MKAYINTRGELIPHIISALQEQRYYGNPKFNIPYGIHDQDTSVWHRLKLAYKNGRR